MVMLTHALAGASASLLRGRGLAQNGDSREQTPWNQKLLGAPSSQPEDAPCLGSWELGKSLPCCPL